MRVLVATTAGPGHLAGLLPFARACLERGHEVRVAAPASFAASVAAARLHHDPLLDPDAKALDAVFAQLPGLPADEADDLVIGEVFGRLDVEASLPGMRELVAGWRPHVILREPAELSSCVAADELGVPHVQCNIGLDIFEDRVGPLFDEALARLGADPAGRRRAPRWTVLPASFDTPARTAADGPVAARAPQEAPSSPDLPPWWSDEDGPLVYVTFGSVAASLGLYPRLYRTVAEQLADLPARVLLTVGTGADPGGIAPLPANVHVERWWPQEDVLPHASLVVGHGGFGTTVGALLAGVPQVVIPLFSFDQTANAQRIEECGVGVALVDDDSRRRPGSELIPDGPRAVHRLNNAVTRVLDDGGFGSRARALSNEAAALTPARDLVDALESGGP